MTSAPESLAEEQAHRIKRYLLTMAVRTVCFVGAAVTATKGASPWVWGTLSIAAILLPYVAVVMANAANTKSDGFELRDGPSQDRQLPGGTDSE